MAMLAALCATACTPTPPSLHTVEGVAQGTTYSLQWTGNPADVDAIAVAAELELGRLDGLLSTYRTDSVLEHFNATHSIAPQALPTELIALFGVAKRVHAASAGCFDPTVRPLVRAWGFDTDDPAPPAAEILEALQSSVGLDKLLILDSEHAQKAVAELEVDMSSIGQGYTAERLADVLEQHGVANYLAEIGGEIVARGTKPGGAHWRVGVENPAAEGGAGPAIELPAEGRAAVITSGTYRHYFDTMGRRYSHILDPRTGRPVEHHLVAVTVLGRDGASTAAWATALLCLGPEPAAAAAQRENVAAFFWRQEGDTATLTRSAAFETEWPGALD